MPDDVSVGRQVRAVRLSKNLRQVDVAARAHVHRERVSLLERGFAERLSVASLRAISRALGLPPVVSLGWRGPEFERLLDEAHAGLLEAMLGQLADLGWQTMTEYSFSHFGERGSVDILAWHPARAALLIIEIKSRLWDLQATLSTLDRKCRLVPRLVGTAFGWRAASVGTLLVMPDTRGHRLTIERHEATFRAALPQRQVEVRHWLKCPAGTLRGIWFLNNVATGGTKQGSCRARASKAGGRGPRRGGDTPIRAESTAGHGAVRVVGAAAGLPERGGSGRSSRNVATGRVVQKGYPG